MNMEATYLDAKRNTSTDVSLDSQGIFFKKKKKNPHPNAEHRRTEGHTSPTVF